MADDKVKDLNEMVNNYYNAYGVMLTNGNEQRSFTLGNQNTSTNNNFLRSKSIEPLQYNVIDKFIRKLIAEFFSNMPGLSVTDDNKNLPPEVIQKVQYITKGVVTNNFSKEILSNCLEDILRTGCNAAIHASIDYKNTDNFDQEIKLEYIDYFSCFFDPSCVVTDATKKDGDYVGFVKRMTKEGYKRQYPNSPMQSSAFPCTAYNELSLERGDDCIQLSVIYRKNYTYTQVFETNTNRIITDKSELFDNERIVNTRKKATYDIEYLVNNGEEILEQQIMPVKHFPLIIMSGYQRIIAGVLQPYCYGYDVLDLQKVLNFSVSQLSNMLLSLRRSTYFFDLDAESDNTSLFEYAKDPMSARDFIGVRKYPMAVPPQELSQSALELFGLVKKEIESVLYQYEAVQGQPSQELSGVAQSMRINQSNIGSVFYLKNVALGMMQLGRVITQFIPLVYSQNDGNQQIDFSNVDFEKLNLNVEAGSSFEQKRKQSALILTQTLKMLPPDLQLLILPEVLKLSELADASDLIQILEKYLGINHPLLYAISQGKTLEQIMQQKQEMSKSQSPNPALMIKQQELQLKAQQQKLENLKALAAYQHESEKLDQSKLESESKIQASEQKSHAEIEKALFDVLKT